MRQRGRGGEDVSDTMNKLIAAIIAELVKQSKAHKRLKRRRRGKR